DLAPLIRPGAQDGALQGFRAQGRLRRVLAREGLARVLPSHHRRRFRVQLMSEDADRANSKPPSLDRLSLLWRRINDRKIVQWSIGYVALAYGIQHGVVLTGDAFDWPHAIQ